MPSTPRAVKAASRVLTRRPLSNDPLGIATAPR